MCACVCVRERAWGPSRDATIVQSIKEIFTFVIGGIYSRSERTISCLDPFEKTNSIILLDCIAGGDTI